MPKLPTGSKPAYSMLELGLRQFYRMVNDLEGEIFQQIEIGARDLIMTG